MFWESVFLGTGIFQTIGAQWLYYQGAANNFSFLTVAAVYLGMMMVFFADSSPPVQKTSDAKYDLLSADRFPYISIIFVSLLDFAANVLVTIGLFLVGSGKYQVIYSSIVAFTAIISKIFLKKKLHFMQWISVAIILAGLWVSAADKFDDESGGSSHSTLGILVTLAGTLMYSFEYVVNEKLAGSQPGISPEKYCWTLGSFSFLFCLIYIVFYTIPNSHDLIIHPVLSKQANIPQIIICYSMLILASFGHNHAYFKLLISVGAVATGVLQALRAISVFALSSILFCHSDLSQCYSSYKGVSTVLVCAGVFLFSYFKNK